MENTSVNEKPSYSTYSSILRSDYLFRKKKKKKIWGLPQRDNSAVETNTPSPASPASRVIVCDTHLECFFFSSSSWIEQCVCGPYLLFHAESLDMLGQFIRGSDEQCGGDGLSVIRLTERWWIIAATLSPPRHAAKWLYRGVLMTCDGCCFARLGSLFPWLLPVFAF